MKYLLSTSLLLASLLSIFSAEAKDYVVTSPDGHLKATVSDTDKITWSIERDGATVLLPSAISIKTSKDIGKKNMLTVWGEKTRISGAKQKAISRIFNPINYKRSKVNEACNELTLSCSGEFNLVVRAYNDGCAYRLVSKVKKPVRVVSENNAFCFADDYMAFVPYVNDNRGGEKYCYSFESYYDEQPISKMFPDSIAITPLAVCLPNRMKAVVMETNVENYPGMFLYRNDATPANTLLTDFAPLPLETVVGGFDRLNLVPTKRADYIADLKPLQQLPWRLVLVTAQDTQLLDTDTPFCLSPECRLADTSWIKPGKVAWDWWNNWNLYNVDFRAGINTLTYKKYIDFASNNGVEYVIVDEGWSDEEDLLKYANDELSIPELVAYGKEKNVGIILWSSWRNLIKDMERNMNHYKEAGVKGFKIDFFDRDDQIVIASAYEMAEYAAKHHLLVDYHGLKPMGVQRAYPNVVNFEGVKGLENCKWEPRVGGGPLHDMPRYDVSIPYLRMLPGPLDYTPGAMLNATRDHFFGNNNHPMSMGTRVHQMAMYVIYEAPLQMMADSPTHYEQNQECTDFIAAIPTTFDETVPLQGEMGEYVAIARRKGNTWYVAAMNNWAPRTLTIDFSKFLKAPAQLDAFADGVNADREATDYRHQKQQVTPNTTLNVNLAPGGGWAAILR